MQSPYGAAARKLREIREQNIAELRRREDDVRARAPQYSEIESELQKAGTALVRRVLEKQSNIDDIRQRIEAIQAKKQDILKSLNLTADYLDELYNCSLCHDTGFTEDGRRCVCSERLAAKYIGENSNLTDKMKAQTFERFDFSLFANQPPIKNKDVLQYAQKIKGIAEDFADNFDKTHGNLFLLGNAGTGKTYLSSCIANLALNRRKTVFYQTSYKLLENENNIQFDKVPDDEKESAEYAKKYARKADLLIIDDLGTEFITQFSTAALFDILNTRLLNGKSTVISTNLSITNIDNIYSGRITSRILGEYKVIETIGKDLRLNKKL